MNIKIKLISFVILLISFGSVSAKTKVACVGNSVTYGAMIENRESNSYPAQLQQMLGDNYEVKNFGKSGATLLEKGHRPYIKQTEYQTSLNFAADIVIIHLGLNDTDSRNWPNYREDFIGDYLRLINSYKEKNTSSKIYICKLTPIFDGHPRFKSGTYVWYHQIQDEIEKVSQLANVPLINLNEDLASRSDLLPDNIHPNAKGAMLIARRVYSSITGDFGGLQVSPIFNDGMVLQRNQKLTINGKADAFALVNIKFKNIKKSTKADFQGKWTIILPELDTERNGQALTIHSKDKTIKVNDVLVGDVWLCSGQSNMAFPLKLSAEFNKRKSETNPLVRLYHMLPIADTNNKAWSKEVLDKVNDLEYFEPSSWTKNDSLSVAEFSAIGINFGSILADSLDVPIGLIQNAVGGSTQESWISRPFLEKDPALVDVLSDFYKNDRIMDWARERAKKNTSLTDSKQQRHPYQPAYLYETAIKPLNGFSMKGVIWYQGESNAHNAEYFELLFKSFVNCFQNEWGQDLPIIYAQLSSINRPSWGYFRNTQRELLNKTFNTHMVVTSDVGDSLDVHPKNKFPIAERMAKTALAKVYKKPMEYSGPEFQSFKVTKNEVILYFSHSEGLKPAYGQDIIGFEIVDSEGISHQVKGNIKKNSIILNFKEHIKPISVKYAWEPFTRANLTNKYGLPASTFKITF